MKFDNVNSMNTYGSNGVETNEFQIESTKETQKLSWSSKTLEGPINHTVLYCPSRNYKGKVWTLVR